MIPKKRNVDSRAREYEKDSVLNIHRLKDNKEILKRWGNFCKKVLKYELDFTEVVNLIVEFIQPIFDLIVKENEFF